MMIAVVFVLFFGLVAAWLVAPHASEEPAPGKLASVPAPTLALGESAA
jgi:hypothetical protein